MLDLSLPSLFSHTRIPSSNSISVFVTTAFRLDFIYNKLLSITTLLYITRSFTYNKLPPITTLLYIISSFISQLSSSLTPFVGDYQAAYTGYAASQYNPMYFTGMDPMHASGSFAGYPVAHTYAPTNAHSAYFQPVQPTIEDSIAAMLAEMSPKRREVALKIKENFPDVDTESFYKFLIKPEEDNNAERKAYVLLLRTFKIPYGYIRDLGDMDCAESTLRGIKRNATVPAEQRPRCTDEEWTPRQVFTMLVCVSEIQAQRGLTPGTDHNIPWAQVADMMARSLGEGAFKFSPMAVHRRYKLEDRFNGDDSDDDNSE
ncbi:hypothetical protein FPOAC1_010317 [Fusarium poae]|uniref:hypothetical protein n=1 Tax=Fusarium poae TaxID=36050 RepID=UPI001CE7EFAD|nr:hypothetical protein FPOAC1_010317 [Fusarium poae]KAG8665520.1 hypothetical protein FPOAC1_010317 [Fusarium poae]